MMAPPCTLPPKLTSPGSARNRRVTARCRCTITSSRLEKLDHPRGLDGALALSRGEHVTSDHLTHHPRHEAVPPGFAHKPTVPLQLIERGEQLRLRQSGHASEQLERYPVADHGGVGQHPLGHRREAAKADANS